MKTTMQRALENLAAADAALARVRARMATNSSATLTREPTLLPFYSPAQARR